MLSKEQGVMVIGVCASYDIFLHWEELWTSLFDKFRSSSKSCDKVKSDTDEVLNGDVKETLESSTDGQDSHASRSTTINGMSAKLCNGGSKVKPVNPVLAKHVKRDTKKDSNTPAEPKRGVLMAVIIRLG